MGLNIKIEDLLIRLFFDKSDNITGISPENSANIIEDLINIDLEYFVEIFN